MRVWGHQDQQRGISVRMHGDWMAALQVPLARQARSGELCTKLGAHTPTALRPPAVAGHVALASRLRAGHAISDPGSVRQGSLSQHDEARTQRDGTHRHRGW
jgi:hypothetical protein